MPTWIDKLNHLRKRQVRNIAQLEQLAGWPKNSLATAIRRKSEPQVVKAMALAKALGVSCEWLYTDRLSYNDLPETLTVEHRVGPPPGPAKKKRHVKKKRR